VSVDWCVGFGRYVNGARLRQVVTEMGTPLDAIGEYVATVASAGGPRWPMGTVPRTGYVRRRKATLDDATSPARLVIRLRAAFGVNARADILAVLLADPGTPVSVSDLASRTRFTKPTVAFALDALVLAGLIQVQRAGNERRVFLPRGIAVLPDLRMSVSLPDWVARFAVALAVSRFIDRAGQLSPIVRAVEARALVDGLIDRLRLESLPTPDLQITGAGFAIEFDRWVDALSAALMQIDTE
jgi:DNA-binding transcriptional ArsR family regulator